MSVFQHEALSLQDDKPLVYTAMSKHLFYARQFISAFALKQGVVPLNPFMNWDYFLSDLVERDFVREGNSNLVKRCDQVWVFGSISNGVLAEIQIAQAMKKPIKYFKLEGSRQFIEISSQEVPLEEEVALFRSLIQ